MTKKDKSKSNLYTREITATKSVIQVETNCFLFKI